MQQFARPDILSGERKSHERNCAITCSETSNV
jgi:hypothetical protein